MNSRYTVAVVAVLAGVWIVWALWGATGDTPALPSVRPSAVTASSPEEPFVQVPDAREEVGDDAAPAPFAVAIAALQQSFATGTAATAAADLRLLLRSDPGALAQAYEALLAEDTDGDVRRGLALVLGTLPIEGIDSVLLAALAQFGEDEAMVISLVAALGALRDPPDEDDVFDLEVAPFFGVAGPGGMGITVRNIVHAPDAERALCQLLLAGERHNVRRAAAAALQWSLDQELSRTRFRTALVNEMNDSVAAILGESLAVWSRRKQGLEPGLILDELVQVADRPGFEEYRLRLETALQEAPLGAAADARLRQWTDLGNPFELRSFAFSALVAQRPVSAATRAKLIAAVGGDPDIALRRHAARLLGSIDGDAESVAALRQAFASSVDWSLRATALTALVGLLPAAEATSLLAVAATDLDPRIVRRAQRLEREVR